MRGPSPAQRGMFSLTDPARIQQVLIDAGLTQVTTESRQVPVNWGHDADDATDFYFSLGPVRANLADVDQATIGRARGRVRSELQAFQTPSGIRMRGTIWLITAICPSTT